MVKKSAQKKSTVKLKKSTTKIRSAKRVKRVLIVVATFLFACTFLVLYSFGNYINRGLASALTPSSVRFMETGYPTVLYGVLEDDLKLSKLQFMIFDLDSKKLISYSIPVEKEMDAPGRVGKEKIASFYEIGTLDSPVPADSYEMGFDYLNNAILKIFGVTAERFVFANSSSEDTWDNFWKSGNVFDFLSLEKLQSFGIGTKSNFSAKELLFLGKFISGLPSDRIIANDYFVTYMDNTEALDQEIRDIMLLSNISQEGLSVAILNGTDVPGLATFGARVVKNLGGTVVAVNNTNNEVNDSVIITDLIDSKTASRLAATFGIDNVISKQEARKDFTDPEIDRADIVVVMGFDLAKAL